MISKKYIDDFSIGGAIIYPKIDLFENKLSILAAKFYRIIQGGSYSKLFEIEKKSENDMHQILLKIPEVFDILIDKENIKYSYYDEKYFKDLKITKLLIELLKTIENVYDTEFIMVEEFGRQVSWDWQFDDIDHFNKGIQSIFSKNYLSNFGETIFLKIPNIADIESLNNSISFGFQTKTKDGFKVLLRMEINKGVASNQKLINEISIKYKIYKMEVFDYSHDKLISDLKIFDIFTNKIFKLVNK